MGNLFKILVLLAILAAGFVYATPYLAVQHLTKALEDENSAKVASYVDFDRVRTGFQTDFVTSMGLDANDQDSVGSVLAGRIAGAFLSGIVSPETMVTLLKEHDRRERLGLSDDLSTLAGHGSWISKNQFVLHDDTDHPTMLLERKGLTWQVVGISLK